MKANRRRDSGPELALRSAMHRAGLRFRVDFPIRTPGARLVRPDVVFPARRIAVFLDGCYWHGCPQHQPRGPLRTVRTGLRNSKRTVAATDRRRRHSNRTVGPSYGSGSTRTSACAARSIAHVVRRAVAAIDHLAVTNRPS